MSHDTVNDTFQRTNLQIFLAYLIWLFVVSFSAEISTQISLDKSLEVGKVFILCALFSTIIKTEAHLNASSGL